MNAIEFTDVSRSFGHGTDATLAVDRLSFAVHEGSVFGLLGANGAGKTTSIRMMIGHLRADSGSIRVLGHDPMNQDESIRQRVAYISENMQLPHWMTIPAAAQFCANMYPKWNRELVEVLADRFHLSLKKHYEEFSKGQRRAMSILLCLCRNAELLIFDEPASGLDTIARRDFLSSMLEFVCDGKRTVLSSSPFQYFDAATTLLGFALGCLLGFRIFWDGGGVRPFLFSCAFSPVRLFTVRWLFGMAIIVACWITVALLIALGIRQATQVTLFANGWYPMIRWMELQVLFCLVLSTLLAYQGTVLLVVWYRFQGQQRFKGLAQFGRMMLTILFILSLVPVLFSIGWLLIGAVFLGAFATSVQDMPVPFSALPWIIPYCYSRIASNADRSICGAVLLSEYGN